MGFPDEEIQRLVVILLIQMAVSSAGKYNSGAVEVALVAAHIGRWVVASRPATRLF